MTTSLLLILAFCLNGVQSQLYRPLTFDGVAAQHVHRTSEIQTFLEDPSRISELKHRLEKVLEVLQDFNEDPEAVLNSRDGPNVSDSCNDALYFAKHHTGLWTTKSELGGMLARIFGPYSFYHLDHAIR